VDKKGLEMNTKVNFEKSASGKGIVYVRPVKAEDLPPEVQTQLPGVTLVYAVHDVNGDQLALASDRKTAFALARRNDFAPVNVH
jgi:hypothetical protein